MVSHPLGKLARKEYETDVSYANRVWRDGVSWGMGYMLCIWIAVLFLPYVWSFLT